MMQTLKKSLRIVMCLSWAVSTFAQAHDRYWLFGNPPNNFGNHFGGSAIDFSSEPPVVSIFTIPFDFEATASICNANGRLIAYSNGCAIADGNHQTLPNSTSLNSGKVHDTFCSVGYPTPQGVSFVTTDPGDTVYRLLHLWRNDEYSYAELRYTDIGSLSSGDSIWVKGINQVAGTGHFGPNLTATQHANGRDWVVIVPGYLSNVYYTFLSIPDTVIHIDTQAIGPAWLNYDHSGQSVVSPDGTQYARSNPYNGTILCDLDRCTGAMSNCILLPFEIDTVVSSGVAFSPSGRYLYVSTTLSALQYDTYEDDIQSSRVVIAQYDGFTSEHGFGTYFYQQMLAPDNRIYITAPNGVRYLHVIRQPERKGIDCDLKQHSMILPTLHSWSVPNFPHFRLGPLDGSPCDTLGIDNHPVSWWRHEVEAEDPQEIRFTDLSYFRPEVWEWDFGDGESGSEQNPIHTFETPGLYHVCLTVSNEYSSDSSCQWVDVMTVETQESAKDDFSVFPNPFTNFIEIHPSAGYTAVTVRILDLNGRVVHAPEVTCPCRLKLDHLPAGVYFYQIEEGTPSQGFGAWRGRLLKSGKVVKM